MKSCYDLRTVHDVSEWESYIGAVDHPHLMQSWPYGEAKRTTAHWHVTRIVFERLGTPVAICQVLEKRLAGLRIASRINKGPLFFDAQPSSEIKENVYRLLRMQSRLFRGGPLLIAPALPLSDENDTFLSELGYRKRKANGWCSSLIDLQLDENTLRARMAPTWRNRLRHSQRSGIRLTASNTTDHLEWLLRMHTQNMKAKNFVGPKTALLRALYEARPADFIILRAMLEDEPIAAMALASFGGTAEYYVGWFGSAAGRKANAGNFLYWEAAMTMKRAGYRWLDLGGYFSSDRFGHFKQGMGGIEYRLIGEWLSY